MAGEHLQRAVHVRAIGGGSGAHGQAMLRRKWSKQALSEQQGGIRELTAQTVEEERARAGLSTVRVFGAAEELVESSVQGRRSSGRAQNGFVDGCRVCRSEESKSLLLVCLNFEEGRKWCAVELSLVRREWRERERAKRSRGLLKE